MPLVIWLLWSWMVHSAVELVWSFHMEGEGSFCWARLVVLLFIVGLWEHLCVLYNWALELQGPYCFGVWWPVVLLCYCLTVHPHQGKAPTVIHASDSIIRLASIDYQKIIFLRIFLPPLIFIALIITLSYIICHNFSIISLVFMQYLLQNKMIFQN